MRTVSMPTGGPPVSVLGFGCAAMLGRSGRRESVAALRGAWDAGITFYDTARSYGYGESEKLLGEFLAGKRTQAVLCTKFGILPAAQNWKQKVKPVVRAAVRLVPSLRGAVQRQAAGQIIATHFSVELMQSSLEASLRSLRTDYVDMLLLHAAPMSVLAQDDLFEALQRLVESGKVRAAGISGGHDVIAAAFSQRTHGLNTAQFAMNMEHMGFVPETRKAAHDGWFLVANHPFGGPSGVSVCRQKIEHLRSDTSLPESLREKLTPDPLLMAEVVLNTILSGTGVQSVIPAMMKPEHLAANIRAVQHCRFTPDELALLRSALA
jgi:aryl-alcohol dehydrogenase-like predicted oxidoreductase